jgi:hypothetical protein
VVFGGFASASAQYGFAAPPWLMRSDDVDARAGERNRVAGLDDRPLPGRDRQVGLVAILDAAVLFPLRIHLAVIEEALEVRHRVGGRRAAEMIAVVVGREQIRDRRQAGGAHRLGNPLRVALGGCTRAAGVDQHRLTARRDHQRRTAAFDVDDVDAERVRALALRRGDEERDGECCEFHARQPTAAAPQLQPRSDVE